MIAGQLEILMFAQLARLQGDMNQAKQVVGGAMDKISDAAGKAKAALGALGVGVGIGAIASMTKGFIDAAAKLDDVAEKTGASVEQLSALQRQARISGESFDTVEMGLVRLSKALHNTDDESKGAGKALAAVGLKAEELRNMDTATALRTVAEAFNKYADGSGKTAAALDIFGKSGAALLPILKDLANDEQAAANVTAKQAAEAEALQKTLRRFADASTVAKQALVMELVPALNKTLNAVVETNKATGSLVQSITAVANVKLGIFGDTTAEQIDTIKKKIEDLNWQTKLFNGSLAKGVLGVRESSLLAALEAAKAIQRTEALALGEKAGGDTRGEMQRFGLPGFAKGQVPHTNAGGGKVDNDALRIMEKYEAQLAKIAEEMRKIDGIDSPFLAMQALLKSDKDLAKLEPALKTRLLDLAEELGIQKALRQEEKEREEGLAKVAEESAAWKSKDIADAAALKEKLLDLIDQLRAIQEENRKIDELVKGGWLTEMQGKLAKLPADVRALLQPLTNIHNEIQQAWEKGLLTDDQMTQALSRVKTENKTATDEITEFWRQGARNIQDSMSSLLFDVMQGKLKDMGSRFKSAMDKMVADALAAKFNNFLFGSDFGKGGQVGGVVGNLFGGSSGGGGFSLLGGGSGAMEAGLGAFAGGGSFMVGGHGGTDSQVVAFRASPDERVTVETPGQRGRGNVVNIGPIQFQGNVSRESADQAAVAIGRRVSRALDRNT